jgi:hypothetical protein
MHFDAEAQPELPVPDHVPDDLTNAYGAVARRTVRRSRSRSYPMVLAVRRATSTLRDADLWMAALTVFVWSIVAMGAIGALVYAVALLPGAVPFLVVPLATLMVVSLAVAIGWERRKARESEPSAYLGS